MSEIINKVLSGRWILTVICGIVFYVCALNKILPADAVIAILSTVFVSYFSRQDRKPEGGTNGSVDKKPIQ